MQIVSTLLAAVMLATPVRTVATGNRSNTPSVHSSRKDKFVVVVVVVFFTFFGKIVL